MKRDPRKGSTRLLYYTLLGEYQKEFPQQLKILLIAVIPHKSRDYRLILDPSFAIKMIGKPAKSVNETSKEIVP